VFNTKFGPDDFSGVNDQDSADEGYWNILKGMSGILPHYKLIQKQIVCEIMKVKSLCERSSIITLFVYLFPHDLYLISAYSFRSVHICGLGDLSESDTKEYLQKHVAVKM